MKPVISEAGSMEPNKNLGTYNKAKLLFDPQSPKVLIE
jgi:hypothetical protein